MELVLYAIQNTDSLKKYIQAIHFLHFSYTDTRTFMNVTRFPFIFTQNKYKSTTIVLL